MSMDTITTDAIPIRDSDSYLDDYDLTSSYSASAECCGQSTITEGMSSMSVADTITNLVPSGRRNSPSVTSSRTSPLPSASSASSSSSVFNTNPYETLCSSCPSPHENWNMLDEGIDFRWGRVSRELQFPLPINTPYRPIWIKITMTLYDKV